VHGSARKFTLTWWENAYNPGLFWSLDRVYSEPVTVPGVPHPPESQWADGLPRWLAVIPILFLAGLIAAYVYGIPMLAGVVAGRLPMAVAESLRTSTLAALDRDMFQPSAMPSARQQDIQSKFRSLKMPAGSTSTYRLEFRKSDEIGANAMALPSGIIVVTDGLVALAEDDREFSACSHTKPATSSTSTDFAESCRTR
jgi:Zn-dependent protease with chaperone function